MKKIVEKHKKLSENKPKILKLGKNLKNTEKNLQYSTEKRKKFDKNERKIDEKYGTKTWKIIENQEKFRLKWVKSAKIRTKIEKKYF